VCSYGKVATRAAPLGEARAILVEGPSREAIELVELK